MVVYCHPVNLLRTDYNCPGHLHHGYVGNSSSDAIHMAVKALKVYVFTTKEAYDFLIDGMENLPDTDPVQPTMAEQMKDMASGVVGWIGQNQGTLVDTFNTVRGLFNRAAATAEETEEVVIDE